MNHELKQLKSKMNSGTAMTNVTVNTDELEYNAHCTEIIQGKTRKIYLKKKSDSMMEVEEVYNVLDHLEYDT